MLKLDRTIQLKIFEVGEDNPSIWLEWRKVPKGDFDLILRVLKENVGPGMDRSGD